MSGRWQRAAVLAALGGLGAAAVLVPAPAQTGPQRETASTAPIAATSAVCSGLDGEPGVATMVSAVTLPAAVLPRAARAGAAGDGRGAVALLAGADRAARPLAELGSRGSTARAPVETASAAAVAVAATQGLAPGLVAEVSALAARRGTVRGLADTTCSPPATGAWFVGAPAVVGSRARLVLANPADVPAVASVRLWDEEGQVRSPGAEDLGVPARGQRSLALDGLAPGSRRLAVQVVVGAGRVSAAVLLREVDGLAATGLSWLPPAVAPGGRVVVPGVPGQGRRTLFVAAPGDRDAVVSLRLLGARGPFAPVGLDAVTVAAGTVAQVDVTRAVGETPAAVELRSDQPVTAAVRIDDDPVRGLPDMAFVAATAPLAGATATFPPAGRTSGLLLTASSAADRTVLRWLAPDGAAVGRPSTVDVPAGATVAVALDRPPGASGGALVVAPAHADRVTAVRVVRGADRTGALLDAVPLQAPPSLVSVPRVAADLSTGLSTGVGDER
jgi:hypothetical protein